MGAEESSTPKGMWRALLSLGDAAWSTPGDHAAPGLFDELKDGEKSIEKCSPLCTSK